MNEITKRIAENLLIARKNAKISQQKRPGGHGSVALNRLRAVLRRKKAPGRSRGL